MKVLHIKSTLEIGGAEKLLADMLPIMSKSIEVAILVNEYKDNALTQKLKKAGICLYTLDYSKLYSPCNIFKIARWLKRYDIIHVHLFPSLYWVALANLPFKKPLIYTEHSTYNKRRNKWWLRFFERWIYEKYSKIVSISPLTECNVKKWVGAKEKDEKYEVVNNGVCVDEFNKYERKHDSIKTLIMIGRFAPAKDQATIIRTMVLLDDDTHLILVGDGENRTMDEELAKRIGVSKRVHFVGTQTNVVDWIRKADIGIQSSKWEGFGITSVEMMASGLPVIATDVDGLKQVVEGAGEIFPVGNEKRLSQLIMRLQSDKEYYNMIRMRCMERAKIYDIKETAKAYINIYESLLKDN